MALINSFVKLIDNLMDVLNADVALKTFCLDTFNKEITVKKTYSNRIEISPTQLPIIIITHPGIIERERIIGGEIITHSVRLYCGLHQPDKLLALDNIIQLEELIDQALEQDPFRTELVDGQILGTSASDEGIYHPQYFLVKEITYIQTVDTRTR